MTCSDARDRVTDGSALRSSSSVSGWQSSPEGYFTGNDEAREMLARVEERTDPAADARPAVEPATLAPLGEGDLSGGQGGEPGRSKHIGVEWWGQTGTARADLRYR
jgi:hypothetical protein